MTEWRDKEISISIHTVAILQILEDLLRAGAALEARNHAGQTALMAASFWGLLPGRVDMHQHFTEI